MSEPATLAEWIARIEAIESIPMRNQVGVVIYWRLFSGMEATDRVPDFDKYLRAWS